MPALQIHCVLVSTFFNFFFFLVFFQLNRIEIERGGGGTEGETGMDTCSPPSPIVKCTFCRWEEELSSDPRTTNYIFMRLALKLTSPFINKRRLKTEVFGYNQVPFYNSSVQKTKEQETIRELPNSNFFY